MIATIWKWFAYGSAGLSCTYGIIGLFGTPDIARMTQLNSWAAFCMLIYFHLRKP